MSLKLFQIAVIEPQAMYLSGGWAVVRAESGERALEVFKANNPGGLLIDSAFYGAPEITAVTELDDGGGACVVFCQTFTE